MYLNCIRLSEANANDYSFIILANPSRQVKVTDLETPLISEPGYTNITDLRELRQLK